MREDRIKANGINMKITECGEGPAVLFCHGFPLIGSTWRAQMEAVANAGYRAIAPDLRGFGESDAPEDSGAYTPFHTVADMLALLDHLKIDTAVVVGQDAGGEVAWSAALLRPDRFRAVFGIYPSVAGYSVGFLQPGAPDMFDQLREAGHTDFYMFRQMRPESTQTWEDAASPIESALYWTSGQPPIDQQWDPFDPAKDMLRPLPEQITWIDPQILADVVKSFQRTGFHSALNYYRSWEPYFKLAAPVFAGTRITQPAFLLSGLRDGMNQGQRPDEKITRELLPDLRGLLVLDDIGHWPQLEAPDVVNEALLGFLADIDR
jgi:pimeloyl-ACP methyl ester carboxylesterase